MIVFLFTYRSRSAFEINILLTKVWDEKVLVMYRKKSSVCETCFLFMKMISRVTLSYPRGEGRIRNDWKSSMEEVMCFPQINVSLSSIVHPIFFLGILWGQTASN
jgi:hypothetical protein